MTRPTFHLVPEDVWATCDLKEAYRTLSLGEEGFIHCTDESEALVATANRHFADDPRPYLVLTIDLDRVGSPWRFDDADRRYPHVYGPIERAAILGVSRMVRDHDRTFLAIGDRLGR